jgi:hypothetical protein
VTIFGYNTDIRHGDTVFHVQTEAHENESAMQSAIFVRGRCIGKHTVSYAEIADDPDFDEHDIHDLVTRQHRYVLSTIREGRLTELLAGHPESKPEPRDPQPAAPPVAQFQHPRAQQTLASTQECISTAPGPHTNLSLEWLSESVVWHAGTASMRFRVKQGASAVEGARIVTRLDCTACGPVYAEGISDCQGEAQLSYQLPAGSAEPARQCTVLVKVIAGSATVTRKFRLQRA